MRQFKRISILIILSVLFISIISCSKEDKTSTSIYLDITGVWQTELSGAPTLYLISDNNDYHIYTYTYPYPIDEADVDSGWFAINEQTSTITFINSITNQSKSYTYKLSDNNNTLTLDDVVYKRIVEK